MGKTRKGIVLAGGSGTRLHPCTSSISKQLLPVFDKPMIYYPLSVLMLGGMREIMVISTPRDLPRFKELLGDGSAFGVEFTYAEQASPDGLPQAFTIAEDFLGGAASCLVLGDNLFYGARLSESIRAASNSPGGTLFAYHVSDVRAYGVIELDEAGKVLSLEEKPPHPRSGYAVPGIYFFDERAPEFAASLKPSKRGETEILDLARCYLQEGSLRAEKFGRGTAWLDTGTAESLLDAASFVHAIQSRQGLMIACLEEIALHHGWLTKDQLRERAHALGKSTYGHYLRKIAE
ncbi:MAG: glucose-1-phosphate thymidylyltransferase RfbA [Chthoniobacterales bacterium]|nr:glucose-1-phosphate thymidylyltransferase RfbA [Chthoniobacterales bacterium]